MWTRPGAAKARADHQSENAEVGSAGTVGELREKSLGAVSMRAAKAAVESERTVAAYAATSMPDFVGEKSMCHTFGRALTEEHSWISSSAYGAYDPVVPR